MPIFTPQQDPVGPNKMRLGSLGHTALFTSSGEPKWSRDLSEQWPTGSGVLQGAVFQAAAPRVLAGKASAPAQGEGTNESLLGQVDS